MTHLLHFGLNKNFYRKKMPVTFYSFRILTPCKNQKKMRQSQEKGVIDRRKGGRTDRYELIGPFVRIVDPNHLTFS